LRAGAVFPVWVGLVFAADNLFNLSSSSRLVIGLTSVGALIAGAVRLYCLYWRKPADIGKTAVYLEQHYGIGDNRLINAIHFDRDPSLPDFFKQFFVVSAESSCANIDLRRVWQLARLKPAVLGFLGGLLLFLIYAVPFAPHAKNAFLRYLNPATSATPLNFTQFTVAPGDTEVIEGNACLIRAKASKFNRPVGGLEVLIKDGNAPLLYPMRNSSDDFAFELRDLSRNTRYAVKNGNDISRWYTVSVIPKPHLDRLTVTVTPPAYTGEKPWQLSLNKREADILKGSHIDIRTGASAQQHVFFVKDNQKDDAAHADYALDLLSDTALAIDVKDARGLTHTGVWQCRFKAMDDRLPEVRFLNRELNVQAGIGQTLPLNLEESDDFGLTTLELFVLNDQKETVLKRIDYREVKKGRTEVCSLPVSEAVFARNASYKIWARVCDNHTPSQRGTALIPVTLHVIDLAKEGITGNSDDPYVRLFGFLTDALAQQKALRDWVSAKIEQDRRDRIGRALGNKQEAVHAQIALGAILASELYQKAKIKKGLFDGISALKTNLSDPLVHRIPVVIALDDEHRRAGLNDVVLKQSEIILALQRILGAVSNDKALEDLRKDQVAEEHQEQKLFDKLQTLKNDLSKFQEDQRKIMADTEALDKKAPEDWTDAEEKLLGDLAAKEQDFSRFFKAAFNDLSKMENQDFSNSTMADELVEMTEELQKAGAALEKKHIEIATVNEELIGGQAESIETNLERWLADAKDNIKWNGEEAGVTPDVPLQDLPAELTDIIGDLIDDVKDMEDVEDSSNSALVSGDKGIGWGSGDGNIDDMSAKGVTGNSMPNNNEVGGRSGEGRSGKSSGQFVEQEATGKGGRNTPTRLVQSPFEKGTVKDSSKDPQGGATGGGKQSGLGGEGLRGITPDQKPDVQQRLPGKQAELKQKAEALLRELNVRNLPTGDLEDAVNKMELIQKYHASGQGLQARQIQSALVSSLKDAQTAIKTGAGGDAEKSSASAKRVSTIRHPENETTPEGYEESVDAYFRALAEPEPGE
jgi:hypothetical protein